ncbi:GAF domain-containing protein [Leifsonia flava]|uniref:GAF domain-containing protein n=1 Tax=Orlajensenia leifsoniae TaxID=2561933 RepID=A0A4Y9R4Z5_9MICO|nr:GAF domain-containing protein [Leifsonia flava]TFV98992.1 GAF domain-containing protein [Leifsonia flava]
MTERTPGRWKRVGLTTLRIVVLAVVAAGGLVLEARQDAVGDFLDGFSWQWFYTVAGWALILLGIVSQVVWGWRVDLIEARNTTDVAQIRVTMKDALKPVLAKVSEMPDLDADGRAAHLAVVASDASWALATLLLRHVDRARVGVYGMSGDGSALRIVGYGGRGEKPGEFLAGRPGADLALQRVKDGSPLIVHDRRSDPPPGWDRESAEWRSFVSVPIVSNDGFAYGMLNVDSPSEEMFQDTEQQIVSVVAEILAIAFALAFPKSERRAPARGRKVGART